MGGLSQPLTAGIIYGVAQPFVSDFARRFNIGVQDEILQIGIAVAAKSLMRNNKLVNSYANAAIIVNTASLARSLSGRMITQNSVSTASTTQTAVTVI